ncbi:hypothetical protein BH11PLA2_BH11PLA2_26550 [soil metagenome]
MWRTLALLIVCSFSSGCLISGGGYSHSSGLKSPAIEILYHNDEPAVLILADGVSGVEFKQNEKDLSGMFTTKEGPGVLWSYEPEHSKSKTGTLRLMKGDPSKPETAPWPADYTFNTAKGKAIMFLIKGGELMAQQTDIEDAKVRKIAKEHRGGFGCQDITLESEKTWKIAAGFYQMTDFLQSSRNEGIVKDHPLRQYPGVTVNYEEYRQKEGMTKRGVCFYAMASAIENARQREPITHGEAISYLGEPDSVTEYHDMSKGTSRLVYEYRLTRDNVKGNVIAVAFEQGQFTKFDYYPEPQMK